MKIFKGILTGMPGCFINYTQVHVEAPITESKEAIVISLREAFIDLFSTCVDEENDVTAWVNKGMPFDMVDENHNRTEIKYNN